MSESPIKKPIIIYLIALAFMISPFISFWVSSKGLQMETKTLWDLVRFTNPIDGSINALIFFSGLLLLRPHKLTWSFAVGCLACVLAFNLYLLFSTAQGTAFNQQTWVSLGATLAGGLILYFFRFPYLDRRDTWTGSAQRHTVRVEVDIRGHGRHTMESVSLTGARVQLSQAIKIQKDFIVSLSFKEIGDSALLGRVVDYDGGKILRLEFQEITPEFKTWLRTLKTE